MTIVNAMIRSVMLGREDAGVLTCWVSLEYGDGSVQGFGGTSLYNERCNKDVAGRFIWRLLDICGVDDWSKIRGIPVRVRLENDKAVALGHFMKEEWLNIVELMSA